MGQYEQQILANTKAIQDIYNDSKTINNLTPIASSLQLNDEIATYINSEGKTVKATFQDILSLVSLVFYSQAIGNKIPIIMTEAQYKIDVQQRPQVIHLYKAGIWQIEHDEFDFSYNNATGEITLFNPANEGDFYEIVWFGSELSKILIIADIDNQTEFNYIGNYINVDVYVNGIRKIQQIEPPEYTRTYFSINNKIILSNAVPIGTIVELIPY